MQQLTQFEQPFLAGEGEACAEPTSGLVLNKQIAHGCDVGAHDWKGEVHLRAHALIVDRCWHRLHAARPRSATRSSWGSQENSRAAFAALPGMGGDGIEPPTPCV